MDKFGPRMSASIGFFALPLGMVAYTFMTGSIIEFFVITIVLNSFGLLTSALVFGRVIVERFDIARGMALGILMTGPSLATAVASPFIGEIISTHGWRAGYYALALISAIGGICAIALVGRRDGHITSRRKTTADKITRHEFLSLVRHPVFPLLVGGMFLINVPQIMVVSQLSILLIDGGASPGFAVLAVSIFAISIFVGRFICGFLLDRVRPHLLAGVMLCLPTLGFAVLMWGSDAAWILAIAVSLIGLAQGGEGDIGAFLTSRTFDLRHYSLIYSFLMVSTSVATAVGSLILSLTLRITHGFDAFLLISGIFTVLGASCFYLTGRYRDLSRSLPTASEEKDVVMPTQDRRMVAGDGA